MEEMRTSISLKGSSEDSPEINPKVLEHLVRTQRVLQEMQVIQGWIQGSYSNWEIWRCVYPQIEKKEFSNKSVKMWMMGPAQWHNG